MEGAVEERQTRFAALMTELEEARAAYSRHIPTALPLTTEPPPVRQVHWEAWERDKQRFDRANEALMSFLRGND
jgi:hypothetical protein